MPHKLSQNHLAILYICFGMLLASIGDTAGKFLAQGTSVFMLLLLFGLSGTVCVLIYGLMDRGKTAFQSNHYKWHIVRGSCFAVCSGLNIYALTRLQIDQFYIFGFTNIFWIVLIGRIVFKDVIGAHRLIAICIGFLTIIYMFQPSLNIDTIGASVALLSGFLQAFAFLPVKFMPQNESRALFALSRMSITFLLALPFVLFYDVAMPDPIVIFYSCLVGALYVVIMIFLSLGYLRASSSAVVAPFHYTQIIWGIVFGYIVFADTPTIEIIIGAIVLILTGIYLIKSEKRTT